MVQNALQDYPGDVYFYNGGIHRQGYSELSNCLEQREQKKSKACLILVTLGGDPDAAYRMARAMRHHYKEVEILIPDHCKSAGTLFCIGANKLIFGDRGELGPLDIQLSKPDEMFENMSGLDIIQAINLLQNQSFMAFRDYLIEIRAGLNIRTKTAADIATRLSTGLVSPIAAKIDPMTLGEHQRAMQIAAEYGSRLNDMTGALKQGALRKLIASYPCHGFVIDRKEAGNLFNCVSEPDSETVGLYLWAREVLPKLPKETQVIDVKKLVETELQQPSSQVGENDHAGLNDESGAECSGGTDESESAQGDHDGSSSESSGNESPGDQPA